MFLSLKKAKADNIAPAPVPGPPAASEVPVEAFLDQTLEEIPTVFGRLAYMAALRDPERDTYRHPILSQILPGTSLDQILRVAHLRIFLRWLEFNLRQQRGDLTRYLGYGELGPAFLRRLRDRDAFSRLPPADAASHERALFTSDLTVIVNSVLLD